MPFLATSLRRSLQNDDWECKSAKHTQVRWRREASPSVSLAEVGDGRPHCQLPRTKTMKMMIIKPNKQTMRAIKLERHKIKKSTVFWSVFLSTIDRPLDAWFWFCPCHRNTSPRSIVHHWTHATFCDPCACHLLGQTCMCVFLKVAYRRLLVDALRSVRAQRKNRGTTIVTGLHFKVISQW